MSRPSPVPEAERDLRPVLAAWLLAALTVGTALLGAVLAVEAGDPLRWKPLVLSVLWAVPAALIASGIPRSALGWALLAVPLLFAGVTLADPIARRLGGGDLAAVAVWYVDRAAALIIPAMTLALMLLPDGRLPSRRWRLPVVLAVGGQVLLVTAWSLWPGTAAGPDSTWPADVERLANPLGVLPAALEGVDERLQFLDDVLQVPFLLPVAALIVRVRRAGPDQRSRLVALALAVAVFVVVALAGRELWNPVADVVDVLGGLLLAVVVTSTVLRRHVEGVHLVVHHAVVFTVMGAVVVGGYVLAVGLLATVGPDLSRFGAGVVAAVAALAVHPLRARLQRWVDRLMHGDRRDPYAAVSRLADSAHRAPSLAEVLGRVATSVAVSLRVPSVRVQAFGTAETAGSSDAYDAARSVRVPLAAGDREVGSLTVSPQPGRRLRPDELRLLAELGRHAGVAVDAVHLAEEVAEHHRALVTTREEERRRLGRELHDGLGPTVAGLSMQLGALRPLVHSDPGAVVARLASLEQAAASALADIRRVAHELRPPVLDQLGLGRAVRQAAESLDLKPVEEDIDHGPLPAAVELAAYRIMTEALSNVARHAGVRTVRLRARVAGSSLVVVVADDGRGPGGSGYGGTGAGLGCSTMRERAEELGGTLTIRPGDRDGTVVTAVLPLTAAPVPEVREEQR